MLSHLHTYIIDIHNYNRINGEMKENKYLDVKP